jgi:hypothetical protein
MSWNNITPAWMLGDFHNYLEQYRNGKLTIFEFYDKIKTMDDVPDTVKYIWKNIRDKETVDLINPEMLSAIKQYDPYTVADMILHDVKDKSDEDA